jgi:hypothetical protein
VSKKKRTSESTSDAAVVVARTTEKKSSRRKSPASKGSFAAPRKSTTPKKTVPAPSLDPSDDEIRMRAYFISERRYRLGLPGDSNSDWLEAKRQLFSEHGPR